MIKILPLGGLGEIGMNCMVLEYGDEIIIVDCGLLFSDLEHFGVEFVIPDFAYLRERKDKIKAIILTHGHEDHIGAIPFLLKSGIRAPLYASNFTTLLLRERLKEYGLDQSTEVRTFKMGEKLAISKSFHVTTVSVNHSIVDAAALIIDTPDGKVIHTGDFKIDPTPFYGRELDKAVFQKAGEDGVLLLMSDSTNVERCDHSLSESMIYQNFEKLFAAAQGLTVIAMFASNVARIGQVLQLAKRMGKKVAVSGRSMEGNIDLGQEIGYAKDAPSVLISLDQISDYDRNQVIVLTSGSQAEERSALARISNGEHKQIKLEQGDLVLMSSRSIPGNEKAIGRMINNLFKHGAEVLYEAIHDIHVSGHATRPELKLMLEWTKPKFFIPIHGEYRHLVHHAALAEEAGVPKEHVVVATNGAVIEIDRDRCAIVQQMEEPRVLIEGRQGGDISKLVLKDRRHMAEKGIVFALMVRNVETRRIMSGPEIVARGLMNENLEPHMLEEARTMVRKMIIQYEAEIRRGERETDLQETVRVELRRFFERNIGRRPTVIPIILDL